MGRVTLEYIGPDLRKRLRALKDLPLREQRSRLGEAGVVLTMNQLKSYRETLIAAGMLPPKKRRVTPADEARIVRLARTTALGAKGIAERAGFDEYTCRQVLKRRGVVRQRQHWSFAQLPALLGAPAHRAALWRRRGWLEGTWTRGEGKSDGGVCRYTRADLVLFIERREAWPTYDPAAITDPDLRAVALSARRWAGGRWMSVPEIARWACLVPEAVTKRARERGWLDGWARVVIDNRHLYWVPDGAELPSFVPIDHIAVRMERLAARRACAAD